MIYDTICLHQKEASKIVFKESDKATVLCVEVDIISTYIYMFNHVNRILTLSLFYIIL